MSTSGVQAQLEDLQQQITELQQQLATATADNVAPNYLSLNSNGQVIANFPGVQLPTTINGQAGVANDIRWKDPATNITTASITAEYDIGAPNSSITSLQAHPEVQTDNSLAWIQARDDQGTFRAGLVAQQTNRGAAASILAQVGGTAKKLLDQSGNSDYAYSGLGVTYATNHSGGLSTTSSAPIVVVSGTINVKKPGANLLYILGCTAYTSAIGSQISVTYVIDGTYTNIAGGSSYYFNQANDHRWIGPVFALQTNVTAGAHTIGLALAAWFGQLTQDNNDINSIVVLELP